MTIFLTVSGLIYTVALVFFFFKKKKVESLELNIYSGLTIVTLISLVSELAIVIVNSLVGEGLILNISLKFYLICILMWTATFLVYVLSISHKNLVLNKMNIIFYFLVNIILCFVIMISPIYFHKSNNAGYSYGPSVEFLSIVSVIYSSVITFICLIDFKKIKQKKYLPVFTLLILLIVSFAIQKYNPEILLMNFVYAFTLFIMYFTIENPDVKMLREITLAKDLAEKANRAKSDFLSSMSHEIRTPLNAIVGLSEDIASYKDRVPKEVVEDTEDILNASQTLLEIVGNILDINKIESEKMDILEVPYDFRKEITSLAKVTSSRIGEKPIEFKIDIAEDIPHELIGDRIHVKGIVNNLLSNAIKYTEKGKVELSAKCINSGDICNLIISVKDTGRGIKAENINKLFAKFERLDVERNSTTEGTGLGLAITKSLVDMMGGKINVQSSFGQGSIFVVQLPQKISKMVKEDPIKNEIVNFKTDYGHKKILIVDDNLLNVKVAKKALSDFDFEIDVCENGEECLNKIKSGSNYDLILMDIMMPVMSGETALKKLKELPGFNTPVIALTADALAGAYEKYKSQGFVDYIAKPFNKEQISEKLEVVFYKLESEDRWRDVPKHVIGENKDL